MPTIDHFRQHWPEVELDLSSGFSFQPLPALARGDLDLVITADPEPRNGITYVPLFTYESVLAISKQHRLMARKHIHPSDLEQEVLITYPVEPSRLDIFNHFLDPAGVEPSSIRTAELTVMMLQLVASGRGVAALPNWALHEYLQREYIAARSLGEKGVWCTLYAAIRDDQKNADFMVDFLNTAKEVSFRNLTGIKSA